MQQRNCCKRYLLPPSFTTVPSDFVACPLPVPRYCKRGVCELYIKELKTYLKADRMSCNSFSANQFRLFLHSAAYVLMLQAKEMLFADTELIGVSLLTFRERVILSAVRITEMKTKIKIEFQNDHAMRTEMEQAMRIAVGWSQNAA